MDNENEGIPQYRVRTPLNPKYDGKSYGVQFAAGVAYLSTDTVPEHLDRTVDEVARLMIVENQLDVTGLTPQAKANVIEWSKQTPAERSGYPLKTPKLKKNVVVAKEGAYRTEG